MGIQAGARFFGYCKHVCYKDSCTYSQLSMCERLLCVHDFILWKPAAVLWAAGTFVGSTVKINPQCFLSRCEEVACTLCMRWDTIYFHFSFPPSSWSYPVLEQCWKHFLYSCLPCSQCLLTSFYLKLFKGKTMFPMRPVFFCASMFLIWSILCIVLSSTYHEPGRHHLNEA